MEVTVKGRNISVTEALERYAFEKVERVSKFFDDGRSVSRAEVELIHERNPSIPDPEVAEATLFINGTVLKAREASRHREVFTRIQQLIEPCFGFGAGPHGANPDTPSSVGPCGPTPRLASRPTDARAGDADLPGPTTPTRDRGPIPTRPTVVAPDPGT